MKAWMKVLMWLGLGAGVGFFAGMQVGQLQEKKRQVQVWQNDQEEIKHDPGARSKAEEALEVYSGEDRVGDTYTSSWESTEEAPEQAATDEDDIPPMPTEDEIEIPDIPTLHPTQFVPQIISESEYEANEWEYDKEKLVYYTEDDVLYNASTQSIETEPNNIIGIGTLIAGFSGNPKNPVDVIFVKNETFGTLYRIERVDDAFCDAVDGTVGPEDDEPEDEDDDFWNDV